MLSSSNPCMMVIDTDLSQAIPPKINTSETDCDMPTDYNSALGSVLLEHSAIFSEHTTVAEHVIETGDASPVKVSVCPIPFHLMERVNILSCRKWQMLAKFSQVTALGMPLPGRESCPIE